MNVRHDKSGTVSRPSPSPAVSQAAAVLRLLARSGEPLGVVAIARATGICQSSGFNLLKTLVVEEFVHFDAAAKKYEIGLGVLQLTRGVLGADAMLRAARPVMNALSADHQATVGLWRAGLSRVGLSRVGQGERMTLIALGESRESTRLHLEVGQRQPLGAGATGRAWLAASACPPAQMRDLFAEVNWKQPVTFAEYEASIGAARLCGYAEDHAKLNRGVITVASPIRSGAAGNDVLHVLSASVLAGSHDAPSLARLGSAVASAADRLATEAVPHSSRATS